MITIVKTVLPPVATRVLVASSLFDKGTLVWLRAPPVPSLHEARVNEDICFTQVALARACRCLSSQRQLADTCLQQIALADFCCSCRLRHRHLARGRCCTGRRLSGERNSQEWFVTAENRQREEASTQEFHQVCSVVKALIFISISATLKTTGGEVKKFQPPQPALWEMLLSCPWSQLICSHSGSTTRKQGNITQTWRNIFLKSFRFPFLKPTIKLQKLCLTNNELRWCLHTSLSSTTSKTNGSVLPSKPTEVQMSWWIFTVLVALSFWSSIFRGEKWFKAVGGRREPWMDMLMSAARQHAAVLLGLTFLLSVSALHTYNTNPSVRLQLTCAKMETSDAEGQRENTLWMEIQNYTLILIIYHPST